MFESNLIEGAGLPLGETRRILDEHFPHIPGTFADFTSKVQWGLVDWIVGNLDASRLSEAIEEAKTVGAAMVPSIAFGTASRPAVEVCQHYLAILAADRLLEDFARALVWRALRLRSDAEPAFADSLLQRRPDIAPFLKTADQDPLLLTDHALRDLHSQMAAGLLPDDAAVAPGQYRKDVRSVGLDIALPAPELVPQSMELWLDRFNRAAADIVLRSRPPIQAAARASYDFVYIHPFPDFNGRMSRLLMSMLLGSGRVPFPVTLRGNRQGRHRYAYALRLANRGDLRAYEALIALQVVAAFREIDTALTTAGLSAILGPTTQT